MLAYVATPDGARIAVQRSGSGTPLVFLTNWGFSAAVFEHQERFFRERHTVYLIEPRGHGASPAHPNGNDYATHASDLAAVFDHFALSRVHLVGWYAGALTALAYCEQYGTGRLASLTGIDLSPRPMFDNVAAWAVGPLAVIADRWHQLMRSPTTQRLFFEFFAQRFMIDRRLKHDELEWLLNQAQSADFGTTRSLFADLMLRNYSSTLERTDAVLPILSIHSRHWLDLALKVTRPLCPRATISGYGGHMMHWEHHERFNAELAAFLAGVEAEDVRTERVVGA